MSLDNQRVVALLQQESGPLANEYILQECDAIEAESASIPSYFRWTLHYKRFQVEQHRGNSTEAKRHLKNAIALAPFNNDIVEDYRGAFVNKPGWPHPNIALLISCKKYESKALQLASQFDQAGIEYLIISGNDTPPF